MCCLDLISCNLIVRKRWPHEKGRGKLAMGRHKKKKMQKIL